jgi:hypothetical protein
VRLELLPLDPATYSPHRLHRRDRSWIETNCYADFWIEALHSLGFDPTVALGFTLSSDFDGDQWTMFKFPPEDLRLLFGLEIRELNVWLPLVDHLADQLALGRLLTVDVDAWYLPDTQGVTYGVGHQKTTIMVQMLDREEQALGYFHNAAYCELRGHDYRDLLGIDLDDPAVLPPYVEVVHLERLRKPSEVATAEVLGVARSHLARRPTTNPVVRFRERLTSDLPWLVTQDLEVFHRYAFGTCRQCGANAELAAEFAGWLDAHDGGGLDAVTGAFRSISEASKALEFRLARAVAGRKVDVDATLDVMGAAWETAMHGLQARYGG